MLPGLPSDQITAAADAGDWPRASALLLAHDQGVRDASTGATISREDGNRLLAEQAALLAILQQRRDQAAVALQALGADRRGALAYLREIAP
jgi:hypothetical protein